jgi:hypothetical protein
LRISTKEQRVKTLEDFGVEVAFQFLDYYLNRSLDNQKAFELETIMRAEIRDSLVCWFFDVLCGFNSMES